MVSTTTLKNAARAIGYDLWSDPDGSHYLVDYDGVKLKRWEPEHDSSDSFELAVALGITVEFGHCTVATYKGYAETENMIHAHGYERHDRSELVRFAIVNAAASIGGALLCQS